MKKVLTIAGSDCSGGAGIQADLKTMTVQGVYGMSAITALTAQNTTAVTAIMPVKASFLLQQLEAIFADIRPDAIKIGMLANGELMGAVADFFEAYVGKGEKLPIVLDPVMISSSGHMLMEDSAREQLIDRLFPWATVITPNLPEAEILAQRTIETHDQMQKAATYLSKKYDVAVLLKGGHCKTGASDVLVHNGKTVWFPGKPLANPNKHGSGCTLSSAIACNLAKGNSLEQSCKEAKKYVERAIEANLDLGKGQGPLNHMVWDAEEKPENQEDCEPSIVNK